LRRRVLALKSEIERQVKSLNMASFTGDPPAAADPTALPDRKELALVAVERTRMPMVVTDPRQPDNPIVLANQAFLDLSGYTSEEVIGRNCRFLQGPQTDPAAVDAIRRGLAAHSDHVDVELLNYRKNGSTFWSQLSISPVMDEAGEPIYYFGSQKDVTARRRVEKLEATERLLLMEIDHRAMNALTLVQSLVRLSRMSNMPEYASSVLGRVDALARAHRLLSEAAWTGVDLGQLVASEAPVKTKERVVASGPPLRLPAPLVQPLALVLHELMSNADKHGALAQREGRVTVSWVARPGQLSLDWREDGAKSAAPPPEPGLGLRLLSAIVEQQLGGTAATSWSSHRYQVEITLPIEEQSTGP
jgi:PAS domain S-box-containing protein